MSERVLAIDYGTKRIGLALAEGPLAEPWQIIPNNQDTLSQLQSLVKEKQISLIVVGISENLMAEKTHQFIAKLKQVIDCPIELIDETLSSYQMHQQLRTAKVKKKRAAIDHLVAANLLQDWLDAQPSVS